MRVVEPIAITDAMITATNVPENDYPAWAIGTTYAAGARVILTSTHRIYESVVAGNIGHDPASDATSTYWLTIGATNRWKVFDRIISDPTTKTSPITYTITPGVFGDSVAFFGVVASTIRVKVTYPTEGTAYDQTIQLLDDTAVIDWWTYFYAPQEQQQDAIFSGLPLYAGASIEITVAGGGTLSVGEIVIGMTQVLGKALVGTGIGIEDFSRKERDAYGNSFLLQRASAQTVSYQFTLPTGDARRVQKILDRLRATPAIYSAGPDTSQFGTTIYGWYQGFDIPLTTNVSFATLEVEGLT